ncbi:hypothetical protein HZA85_04225 [Candidatus Uhrbacteria bacterium]|nr:hypothetical protein [Candidatus Uhrbacteria bacterium]
MKKVTAFLVLIMLVGAGCSRQTAISNQIGTSHFGRLVGGPVTESFIAGGWVRPHPGPFWWDQIETSQDVYEWSQADQTVQYWQARHQAILATLWPFAQWDQERCRAKEPKVKNPFGSGLAHLGDVCHNDSFQEWVQKVVERYDGDGFDDMPGLKYPITHWEVGNEPDLQTKDITFFQSGPNGYVDVLRLAREVILKADSNAVIVPAGMSGMQNQAQTYWRTVLQSGHDLMTMGNVHSIGASEDFFARDYRLFLNSANLKDIPFWMTEALVGSQEQEWSDEQKAPQTLIGYASAFASGAQVIFDVGKNDPTGGPGEPAEQTFQRVVQQLDHFEKADWLDKSVVRFTIGRRTVYVLWAGAELPEDVKGRVTVWTYDGKESLVDARSVKAEVPMFAY